MALLDEQAYVGYPQMGRRRAMPNRDVEMNQGLLRGASYYPTDLLGSPVDLINMALKPMGLGSQKPVMGSDYLQSLAQQYGLSQQPTGSNAENVARLAMSAMNPATGARAVGRVVEPTMQALGPKAGQMAEDYLRSIGGIADVVPQGKRSMKAMDVAQQNATLPLSEGGLGLLSGNTAAERAAAQGYIDYYHGTERLDRLLEGKTLNPKRATSGPMPYGTDSQAVASGYATSKQDTSRVANDTGDMANYFQVSPKALGDTRGRTPYTVEQTWYRLPSEKKAEILDKAQRVGYENLDDYSGKFITHKEGVKGMPISEDTWNYYLNRESNGNPLTALRKIWAESGNLGPYDQSKLADIYKLAGYPHEISQSNAPWASASGVMLGKARITNPLVTDNVDELKNTVLPALQEAFKNDRTKTKAYGADQWDKNTRFTPKQWVDELSKDLEEGKNSYVWTSIPDKVTNELKNLGYNGIIDTGGKMGGEGHQVVIPFEPSQVRSRFANFDPKKVNEPSLLAGAVPFGLLGDDEEY